MRKEMRDRAIRDCRVFFKFGWNWISQMEPQNCFHNTKLLDITVYIHYIDHHRITPNWFSQTHTHTLVLIQMIENIEMMLVNNANNIFMYIFGLKTMDSQSFVFLSLVLSIHIIFRLLFDCPFFLRLSFLTQSVSIHSFAIALAWLSCYANAHL